MDPNHAIAQIQQLTSQLFSIHPSDKVRVTRIVDNIVRVLDEILSQEIPENIAIRLGEVLDNLRKSQYYAFSDIVSRSKYGIKINDLIQKVRFNQLNSRLRKYGKR